MLDDPAGQGVDAVRPIRDEIRARVEALVAELAFENAPADPAADLQASEEPVFTR